MNLNPSPDQNHLLDDSGEVVAEFVETVTRKYEHRCRKCIYDSQKLLSQISPCTCRLYYNQGKSWCMDEERNDGKNGYWKEIESNGR